MDRTHSSEYEPTKHPMNEVRIGDIACKYTNDGTTLDVYFLITLFLMRGNSVAKILATIPSEVKDIVSRKLATLGIALTAEKRLTAASVTLARLSQTFPQVTAAIILGQGIDGKLQPKWLLDSILPRIMQHSVFSGLIPKDSKAFGDLKVMALALNLEMTVMLQVPKEKRRMESKDISELSEMSEKYVMAAINGTICTGVVQTKILKAAGIIDANGDLEHSIVLLASACTKFLNMKDKTYRDAVKAMLETPGAKAPNAP